MEYTYCSDLNNDVRTIDHFFIFNNLSDRINKHCIINNVNNRSDNVLLRIYITMPISCIDDTRHFVPEPKWHSLTPAILSNYKRTLDELLSNCTIPGDVLSCNNLFCEDHSLIIDSLHEHIVKGVDHSGTATYSLHLALFRAQLNASWAERFCKVISVRGA